MRVRIELFALGLLLTACGGDEPVECESCDTAATQTTGDTNDTALTETSDTASTGTTETGTTETGTTDTATTGTTDTVIPGEFGEISGDCGVFTVDNLSDSSPWSFQNEIDFGEGVFSEEYLSDEGVEILEAGNAGGSSLYSEIQAFEVLRRCEEASLLKTEGEITYTTSETSITDLLLEIDALKVGVSVTRAYGWPPEDPYTTEQAVDLLTKKLEGILESSANVSEEDEWVKQVLHVIAYTPDHSDTVVEAFGTLDEALRGETILMVTATEGEDEFLY